jgi:hypothetical protein
MLMLLNVYSMLPTSQFSLNQYMIVGLHSCLNVVNFGGHFDVILMHVSLVWWLVVELCKLYFCILLAHFVLVSCNVNNISIGWLEEKKWNLRENLVMYLSHNYYINKNKT